MTNSTVSQQQRVPYLDLSAQNGPLKAELLAAISEIIDKNAFVLGPGVESFERHFAEFCNSTHCVAVNTGTAALHVALLAEGIGPGDEVITQANTFFATIASIMYTGATPVLVDISEPTFGIDVSAVEAAITPRTKAILPVHLFGHPCDLNAIYELATRRQLTVIEDASQAHGATYKGAPIGSHGTATFSFYPGKNLGACGEGGGVVTKDAGLAERMRILRNHGMSQKYKHDLLGYNYRLEGMQGAILDVKVRHLQSWTEARNRVAQTYDDLLADFARPQLLADTSSAYHVYSVLVDSRDEVRKKMLERGVETNVHYPIPCHKQPGFVERFGNGMDFPVSETFAKQQMSLPIFPEMTDAQVEYVAHVLREATKS